MVTLVPLSFIFSCICRMGLYPRVSRLKTISPMSSFHHSASNFLSKNLHAILLQRVGVGVDCFSLELINFDHCYENARLISESGAGTLGAIAKQFHGLQSQYSLMQIESKIRDVARYEKKSNASSKKVKTTPIGDMLKMV